MYSGLARSTMFGRAALAGAAALAAGALAATPAAIGADLRAAKCKRGQVQVRIQGKLRCRPLRTALPRPRRGDQRASMVTSAGTMDLSFLRDRSGKRAPSPSQLYGSFGPGAYQTVKREIPRVLARLDALARPARTATRSLAASYIAGQVSCPPGGPPTPALTDRATKDLGGGVTLTSDATLGPSSSMAIGLRKGGDGLQVGVDLGSCDEDQGFSLRSCPTAAGALDGTYRLLVPDATTTQMKDGVVAYSQSVRYREAATFRGRVGEDAKLDFLDIQFTVAFVVDVRDSGGSTITRATITRRTRVNMRTGAYEPTRTEVNASVQTNGRTTAGTAADGFGKGSESDFALLVGNAINRYRRLETEWNKPNTCATLSFDPPSRSLRLQAGQSGRFRGKVDAKRGGGNPIGRWKLVAARNATIFPTRARAPRPQFVYRVTRAGTNVPVSAAFLVTSPAGVARGSWEQGTRLPARWRGEALSDYTLVESGRTREESETRVTIVLKQSKRRRDAYEVESGTITWTARGSDDYDCTWTGSGSRSLNKYDLFMELWLSRLPYRAAFSAQDEMAVTVTWTCPWGTRQGQWAIGHPLALLGRETAGVPVDANLTTIKLARNGTQVIGDSSLSWDFALSLTAR